MCSVRLIKSVKAEEEKYTLRRSWYNYDQETFLHDLINQEWERVIDVNKNVHQQSEAFDEIFESTLNRHAQLKKTKIRPHFIKGLSTKTKTLIKKRNRLRLQSSRCKDPLQKRALQSKFNKMRNSVTSSSIKEAKTETLTGIKEN